MNKSLIQKLQKLQIKFGHIFLGLSLLSLNSYSVQTVDAQESLQAAPAAVSNSIEIPRLTDWQAGMIAITHGSPGEWDRYLWGGFANSLIKRNNVYYLYYQGSPAYDDQCGSVAQRGIGVATSTDGIHWTKSENNPVISWSSQGSVEEGAVSSAAWVGQDGKVYIYYGANTGSGCTVRSDARLAVSNDGEHFQDVGEVLSGNDPGIWGAGDEISPVGAYSYEDRWYMYYIPNGVPLSRKLGVAMGNGPDQFTQTVGLNNSSIPAWGPVSAILEGPEAVLITNPAGATGLLNLYRFSADDPSDVQLHDSYTLPGCTQASVLYESSSKIWMMACRDKAAENYRVRQAYPRYVSGSVGVAGATLTYKDGMNKTARSLSNGKYLLPLPDKWSGTVTPSHACFTFTPTSRSYTTITSDQTSQNYAVALYPPAGCADIDISTGQTDQGRSGLPPATSARYRYPGVNNGPLNVVSNNNLPIITSQRVIFGGKSYSEMMGLPAEQLSQEYWFPYYNNVAMDSQLRVSNMGAGATTITVTLGGAQVDSYVLAANSATRKNYPGMNGGPLRVYSSATNILSTVRVLFAGKSYSELMGLPMEQLTNKYLFPYYNNVAMDSQLRVSNLGGVSTTITVKLGNVVIDSYPLAAGAATRKNYPGLNSGPLEVSSSATNILSTIRVLYKAKSYSELMGFPSNQLAQEYWYPVYDNVTLDSQLRVSNVGTGPTTITVYAGGVQIDSYDLAAGAATRTNYPQNTGPLRVVSSPEPILTTIRMLYGASLYEMTGLPNTQLSAQYYFPWYNNAAMNSELRFALP